MLQAWSFRGVPAVFPAAESSVFLSALAARPGEEPWIYTRGRGRWRWTSSAWSGTRRWRWSGRPRPAWTAVRCRARKNWTTCWRNRRRARCRRSCGKKWNAPSMYGRPDRQTVGGGGGLFCAAALQFSGAGGVRRAAGPPPCVHLLPPVVRAPAAAGPGGGAPPGGKIPARLRSGHPGGSRRLAGVQPQTGRAAVANGPGTDGPGREGGPRSLDAGSGPAAPAASRAAPAAAGTPGPP